MKWLRKWSWCPSKQWQSIIWCPKNWRCCLQWFDYRSLSVICHIKCYTAIYQHMHCIFVFVFLFPTSKLIKCFHKANVGAYKIKNKHSLVSTSILLLLYKFFLLGEADIKNFHIYKHIEWYIWLFKNINMHLSCSQLNNE